MRAPAIKEGKTLGVRFEEGSPEQLFHALDRKHRKAVDKMLFQRGLGGIGQPLLLCVLAQRDNGTVESQKELAKKLRVSPATVTVSLKSMERDGYVKKLSDAEDLRRKPISITEKGREAVRVIDEVLETIDHGMYRGFSREELAAISGFYRRIIDNLDETMASGTV